MKYSIMDLEHFFVKEEVDSTSLLYLKEDGNQIYLNKTGTYIFKMLCENEDSDDVFQALKIKYPNIDARVLEYDFNEFLDVFELYDIVKFSKSRYDNTNEFLRVKYVEESNYRDLSKFIIDDGLDNPLNYYWGTDKNLYNPISLRYNVYENKEYYVIAIVKGQIIAAIGIIPPNISINMTVVSINSLFFKKELDDELIEEILSRAFETILKNMAYTISKFRINIREGNKLPYKNILYKLGFEKECVCKHEFGDDALEMFALVI